jgi:hypothetical protein
MECVIMVGKFLEQNNLDIGYNDTKGLLFLFACNRHVHYIHYLYLLNFFNILP